MLNYFRTNPYSIYAEVRLCKSIGTCHETLTRDRVQTILLLYHKVLFIVFSFDLHVTIRQPNNSLLPRTRCWTICFSLRLAILVRPSFVRYVDPNFLWSLLFLFSVLVVFGTVVKVQHAVNRHKLQETFYECRRLLISFISKEDFEGQDQDKVDDIAEQQNIKKNFESFLDAAEVFRQCLELSLQLNVDYNKHDDHYQINDTNRIADYFHLRCLTSHKEDTAG